MDGGPRRWIPARSSDVRVSQTLCGARAGPGGLLPGPAQDQRGVAADAAVRILVVSRFPLSTPLGRF